MAKRPRKPAESKVCLTPHCEQTASARGICVTCYSSHRRAIERGETTWEELQSLGLSRPNRLELSPALQARQAVGIRTA